MRTLLILTLAIFSSQTFAKEGKLKDLPKQLRQQVMEQVGAQLELLENVETEKNQNEIWPLARIDFQTFAFLEYDIFFFEMKIKPYVELRWDKKNQEGYVAYHPEN